MPRQFTLLIILLFAVLVACGGGNDDKKNPATQPPPADSTSPPQVVADPESWLYGLAEPTLGVFRLPVIENAGGHLLFMQGNALYLAAFDGARATLLADYVNPATLALSPAGDTLAYVTVVNTAPTILLFNLTTLESTPLATVSAITGRVIAWSPNSQWLLVAGPGAGELSVYTPAGHLVQTIIPAQTTARRFVPDPPAAWLDDNRLLYLDPAALTTSTATPAVFDPATGEYTPVNGVALDATTPYNLLAIESALQATGLRFAPAYSHLHRATRVGENGVRVMVNWPLTAWNLQTQPCDIWQIAWDSEIVYTAENTAYLSDLTPLPDGGILFLEWTLPACSLNSHMRIALRQLEPGVALRTLSDDVVSASERELATLPYLHTTRYTLTPDGRYVIWAAGSVWINETALKIADLQTGQQATLLRTGAPAAASLIVNVIFVPNEPSSTSP